MVREVARLGPNRVGSGDRRGMQTETNLFHDHIRRRIPCRLPRSFERLLARKYTIVVNHHLIRRNVISPRDLERPVRSLKVSFKFSECFGFCSHDLAFLSCQAK